jgi:hypothetical protein
VNNFDTAGKHLIRCAAPKWVRCPVRPSAPRLNLAWNPVKPERSEFYATAHQNRPVRASIFSSTVSLFGSAGAGIIPPFADHKSPVLAAPWRFALGRKFAVQKLQGLLESGSGLLKFFTHFKEEIERETQLADLP